MLSEEHLNALRSFEIGLVLPFIPPGEHILEIGSGSGWQAKILAAYGFNVKAIDVTESKFKKQVWEVEDYDGRHIPFPDSHFGVIFSSNVLEHIRDIEAFQKEMLRVLKPGGVAIHILPTGTWRFHTNFAHYFFLVKLILNICLPSLFLDSASLSRPMHATLAEPSWLLRIRRVIAPSHHGETGNFLTELYYFSKFRWQRMFKDAGWSLERYRTNTLMYTGYGVFGLCLPIEARRVLSIFLGSSCHIFVLRKAN